MKKSIREHFDRKNGTIKEEPMAAEPTVSMTQEDLQNLLRMAIEGAVAATKKLNPLEERKLKEQLDGERRRTRMIYEMGKIETEAILRKKNGCSHMRDPKTGNMVLKGTWGGEWTTGGQMHGDGTATVLCMRCGELQSFNVTAGERELLEQRGCLGLPMPDDSKCLAFCGYCGKSYLKPEIAAHEKPCRERLKAELDRVEEEMSNRASVAI